MTELRKAHQSLQHFWGEVRRCEKLVAELEAGPGIVTFRADVESTDDGESGLVERVFLKPFVGHVSNFAVSEHPFACYPGVEVARGVYAAHVFDGGIGGILTDSGYRDVGKFVTKHAKPGFTVAVIDPGGVK